MSSSPNKNLVLLSSGMAEKKLAMFLGWAAISSEYFAYHEIPIRMLGRFSFCPGTAILVSIRENRI